MKSRPKTTGRKDSPSLKSISWINIMNSRDGITMELIVMCILGGSGTVSGPIVGAFSVTIIMEWMRFLGDYRMLIYGLLVILLVMFMTDGIVGKVKPIAIKLLQKFFNRNKVQTGASDD